MKSWRSREKGGDYKSRPQEVEECGQYRIHSEHELVLTTLSNRHVADEFGRMCVHEQSDSRKIKQATPNMSSGNVPCERQRAARIAMVI